MKNFYPLLFLFLISCAVQPESTATPALPTATAVSTNTPVPPTPTPNYLWSDLPTFTAKLNQQFGLKWDQSVEIPTEGIVITHTTDIEFECPANHDCEVPLIATDYFEFEKDGESLGQQSWQPELVFGEYVLETAVMWSDYNYDEHQFEIVMLVRKEGTE